MARLARHGLPASLRTLRLAAMAWAGVAVIATLGAHGAHAADSTAVTAPSGASSNQPSARPSDPAAGQVFATVGSTTITVAEYERAVAAAMRRKYYHAKPPEAELAKFRRDVADDVVNRVLLLAEARRRSIDADKDKIAATVAGYDRQYGSSANWQANRERMLSAVVPQLEADSVLERLEKRVRDVPAPTAAQVKSFYEQNKKLFVEPEQVKLAVILLKVDPSSRAPVWEAARQEGARILEKLRAGADFAELARLHSGDQSSADGGTMEYVHRGMLPEPVQAVVDGLKVGQIAEPVQLLEGVTILRLDGRRPAQQRSLDEARARAAELWKRERGQVAWASLVESLRKRASIRIDDTRVSPAAAPGARPTSG